MASIINVDTINEKTTGNGIIIPGHVIQVVDSGAKTGVVNCFNQTFVDTSMNSVAITPKSSSSKILVTVTQNVQVWNSGNPYATGRWRIMRNVAGGAYTAVYQDTSTANGNIFAYDYGGSGVNIYRPTAYTLLDSPNTTSQVIYKTQIALGSNGGNRISTDSNDASRMILMEIAQ